MSDFTLVPPEDSITDSASNKWSLGAAVAHGQAILRNGVQFADGQGTLLLYYKQKVYTRNDLHEWWVATNTAWQRVPDDPRGMPDEGDLPHNLPGGPSPLKHPFAFGLGMAPEEVTPQQAEVFRRGFESDSAPAFKFLTLGRSEMINTYERVRAAVPQALFLARLYCEFNADDPLTPDRFVQTAADGLTVLYERGVRLFEVHNEPNLPKEGLGSSWKDAVDFAGWLQVAIKILRPRYPEAKWLAPGLSPKDQPELNTQLWLNAWKAQGVQNFVDGFCAHAYWQTMTDEPIGDFDIRNAKHGGREWLDVKNTFPGKPIYITEFSNNAKGVPFREKGRQYRVYRDLVKQEGAAAAFGFVLHWVPPPDEDHDENWAHNNGGSLGVAEGYRA
jgi:hypothetical protein